MTMEYLLHVSLSILICFIFPLYKTVSAGLTVGGCGSSSCSGYGAAVALAMVLAMVMSVALMVFPLN